jgi:cytochrome c-type protein NapB
MKKIIMTLLVPTVALMFVGNALAEVTSLRGDNALNSESEKAYNKRQLIADGGIARSYNIQPPMIPHRIDKETVNLKMNTCMKCHSEKTYEKKHAPKLGDSHYVNREDRVLERVSARRYFCLQCHATQVSAPPLVDNLFEGQR